MIDKSKFFKENAQILNKFLRLFQTDNALVSFLCNAYDDILSRLMKISILMLTVDNLETPYPL